MATWKGGALAPLFFWLAGCAYWETHPSHAPLPPWYVEVPYYELGAVCRNSHPDLVGCAIRSYEAGRCYIVTEKNAPQWVYEHERKHCAGYSHR